MVEVCDNYKSIKLVILLILIIALSICLSGCGRVKTPNCEAEETKAQLIGIFEENFMVGTLDYSSVEDIQVIGPSTISYDKDIDKYTCSAKIYMKSVPSGFIRYNSLSDFFSYTSDRFEYTTEISEGNLMVLSSVDYGSNRRNWETRPKAK